MLDEVSKKKLIVKECTCPVCGSSKVDYDYPEFNDDVMSYSCTCQDCYTEWNEYFTLIFCGISKVYDKDGNKLDNVINLNGEEDA